MSHCTCPPDSCDDLVRGVLLKDQSAEHELYEKFRPRIQGIVRRRLGARRSADWEEADQQILWRVFVKLDTWKGIGSGKFCYWVNVLASRYAINIAIKLANEGKGGKNRIGDIDIDEIPAPRDLDPAVIECFEQVTTRFNDKWRQALELRSQGLVYKEIADHLKVTERTIKHWFAVMYSRLSECLTD